MNCKKCGFEMADNAKFCPQCGAKADEEAMSSVNTQNNDENEENDAEEVVTENDKEQEDISNETDTKFSDNKKKILIIASIAVVIIIIIAVISSKSGSSDNSYTGNADTDSGYNDIDENYDDDFGNDDVVTEPETTENITFDYKVEYDKELVDNYETVVKIENYQFLPEMVLGDCYGVNLILDFSMISADEDSFSYRIEGYDKNDNLVYSSDEFASFINGKSRDEVTIFFDDLNGDLYKIVILGD